MKQACPARHRNGTTLIEVAVMLTIVAIIAAVTVPALPSLVHRDPLDDARVRLREVIHLARIDAIQRGATMSLTIDPKTRRFWLRSVSPDSVTAVDTSGMLVLAPDVSLSADGERVQLLFAPTGTVASQSLVIRSGADAQLFGVDPWTGEITVSAAVRDEKMAGNDAR
jgi:Tfp pilus assembly protein FimT